MGAGTPSSAKDFCVSDKGVVPFGHKSRPITLGARYVCSFCGEGGDGHIRSPEKDLEPIRF
jgi:hypothetical protein